MTKYTSPSSSKLDVSNLGWRGLGSLVEEIAATVADLASDGAGFTTGQAVVVDGGGLPAQSVRAGNGADRAKSSQAEGLRAGDCLSGGGCDG